MTKIISPLKILVAVLLISSCAKLPMYPSKKIEGKVPTDNLQYYTSLLQYDVYNDDENVILHMSTPDYMTQVKILKLGFTIWLDQKGKKNTMMGIKFPQKQAIGNEIKQAMRSWKGSGIDSHEKERKKMEKLHKDYEFSTKNMTLVGMNGEGSIEVVNTALQKSAINVSITFDEQNNLHYLATIPIKSIFTQEKHRDSIFSVGFQSGFFEMRYASETPNKGGMSAGGKGGGGGRSGGGGGPGGGGGGAKGGNQATPNSALAEPIKTWFKVQINPTEK